MSLDTHGVSTLLSRGSEKKQSFSKDKKKSRANAKLQFNMKLYIILHHIVMKNKIMKINHFLDLEFLSKKLEIIYTGIMTDIKVMS